MSSTIIRENCCFHQIVFDDLDVIFGAHNVIVVLEREGAVIVGVIVGMPEGHSAVRKADGTIETGGSRSAHDENKSRVAGARGVHPVRRSSKYLPGDQSCALLASKEMLLAARESEDIQRGKGFAGLIGPKIKKFPIIIGLKFRG